MISFEFKDDGDRLEQIEIHLSRSDARELAEDLLSLSSSSSDNRSLGYFSEAWGGEHLADLPVSEGYKTIKGVRVYLLD